MAGITAGVLLALYPTAILSDCLIEKSVLDVLFVCVLLLLLGRQSLRANSQTYIAAGIVLGMLTLTRENSLVLFPIIFAWLFVHHHHEPGKVQLRFAASLVLGLVLEPAGGCGSDMGGST